MRRPQGLAIASSFLLGCALLGCAGFARADSGLRGPVSGFVFDPRQQTIRPINGLPGSSHLGAPIELPFALRLASMCSGTDLALAISGEDNGVFVVRGLRGTTLETIPVEGAIASPDLMVCNQAGSAGLLYFRERGVMQFLSGLSDQPKAGAPFDVSSLGEVRTIAIHPSASQALVGASNGTDGFLYLVTGSPDAAVRSLGRFGMPSAAAYVSNGKDAIVADSSSNEVSLIADVAGSAAINVLARESDGIQTPIAVQPAGENRLLIANAGSNTISVLDTRAFLVTQTIPLTGKPTRCELLTDRQVFALTTPGDGSLLVLDFGPEPKVFFILLD